MTGVFTAGSVLTAANLNTAINTDTINAQTGAGYTLVLTDAGKTVTLSNASAQNLTIPLNASVAFATGTRIDVVNIGTGTWALTGSPTINGTIVIPSRGGVQLLKTGTDTWWASAIDAAARKVVQVVSSTTTTVASSNSSTYADTNLSATITPTNANNVILVFVAQNGVYKSNASASNGVSLRLMRGASPLVTFGNNLAYTGTVLENLVAASLCYVDSPATTSATTYKTQFASTGNTASVSVQLNAVISTIILMEVTP